MENILISELVSGNSVDNFKIINYSVMYKNKNVLNYLPATNENIICYQNTCVRTNFNLQAPNFNTLLKYSEYIKYWYNSDEEILIEVRNGNLKNLTLDIYLKWFRFILPNYIGNKLNIGIIFEWIYTHHPEDLYKTIIENCLVSEKKKYLDFYGIDYDSKYLERISCYYPVELCIPNIHNYPNNNINLTIKNNFYILKFKNKELCINLFLESTIRFHFFIHKLGYFHQKEITTENFDELLNIYYTEYQGYGSPAYYIYNYVEQLIYYDKAINFPITDEYTIFYYNYKLKELVDISKYNNIVNYCSKYERPDLDLMYNLYKEELFDFVQHLFHIRDIKNGVNSKYIEIIYQNIPKYTKTDFVNYLLSTMY